MGLWEQFGNTFSDEHHSLEILKILKMERTDTLGSNFQDKKDFQDRVFSLKNEHGQGTRKPPAPKDGNALLSTLDLRNVRPWQEGRRSPRRWLKPPLAVPEDSEPPGTARTGNSQAVAARTRERRRGEPVPGSMRWTLLPCTLVPIALELDAAGALTWQAGQFDDNVRALCEEHGAQLRAFLSTLPGHRWESWQENALDIADRWEASQGRQSIKQ